MKLKKCQNCKEYTLKENCDKCKEKTKNAHYKFIRIKNAPRSDVKFVRKG